MNKIVTVDEYIKAFQPEVREILEKMRRTVKKAAPKAKEIISYGMPAYKIDSGRPIVFFATFKHHIGFYPPPLAIETFKSDLAKYKSAKGSVRFPLNEPVPYQLITKMVKFCVQEKNKKAEK